MVKASHTENYKMLLEEIKEVSGKISCVHGLARSILLRCQVTFQYATPGNMDGRMLSEIG